MSNSVKKEGTFVLIASVNNHTKYNGEGILRDYKKQTKDLFTWKAKNG